MADNRQFVENIAQLVNRTQRTKFNLTGNAGGLKLTTMNKGYLYPIFCEEVLPGDTWKINIGALIRATTMIKPIMNNMWAQVQCFFVPNRLTYKHWEEVMGENKQGPWITNKTTYEVPKLTAPAGGWAEKTLADYLGVPTKKANIYINSLYTKGYAKICNDWYRDEDRMNFTHITEDETNLEGSNGTNYVTDIELGGALFPVAKAHDIFTSSAIEPQKGPTVLLPIGAIAPVIGNGNSLGLTNGKETGGINSAYNSNRNSQMIQIAALGPVSTTQPSGTTDGGIQGVLGVSENAQQSGLIADLSNATSGSVNDLRIAIALQQMYELDAMAGTRYTEIIFSHFGVKSSDARLQRSEYLGGKKIPITISQVIQNSETQNTPQGNLAGMSQTFDGDDYFTKSFEEHGLLYILCCIKGENIYQQGLPAKFSKFKRTDYYDPLFANLGMQPILNKEIYAQGTNKDNEAFGYKEAWAEYRYLDKQVTGEFRSNAKTSIDYWHIARDFDSLPTNGEEFIKEGQKNLDRTLTVASTVADQFQAAFALDAVVTRVMPPHSIPGLRRF